MDKLLALVTSTFLSTSITVVDGDTLRFHGERVRLQGFDAPESSHPKCEREARLANRATIRLRSLVADKSATLTLDQGTTCGYGRRCGTLMVNGENVGTILIREGLASPMVCDGPPGRHKCPPPANWCSP